MGSSTPLANRSASTRRRRVQTWLEKAPPYDGENATHLALLVHGDDGHKTVLWQCTRSEKMGAGDVATDIDTALQDAADEQGVRVTAMLTMLNKDRSVWTEIGLRASPAGNDSQLDGSAKSMLIQEQKHKEAFAKVQFDAINQTLESLTRTNEALTKRLEARDDRYIELENEVHDLRKQVSELDAALSEAHAVIAELEQSHEEAVNQIETSKSATSDDGKMLSLVSNLVANQKPAAK